MSRTTSDAGTAWAGTRLRGAPRGVALIAVGIESSTLAIAIASLAVGHATGEALVRFGLLAILCIAFEEISLQAGKLRQLISTGPLADMTSVWTFAAALVLPAGYGALFALLVSIALWLRVQRASGYPAFKMFYGAAATGLAVLSTTAVSGRVQQEFGTLPEGLTVLIAVVAAAVVYTVINRSIVIVFARQIYPEVKLPIIGTWDDNALELATLCLGAMTGVVLLHEPWVSVLVLLPMVLLQRGALIKDLERAASTDAKTGLLNATVWHGSARRELARVDRNNATAAVLILDLDHFKSVNDDHGHLFGDAALLAVGTRLKAEVRQYDLLGRFGGEEFVVLLPRVTYSEATAAAERLRVAIASIVYEEFGDAFLQVDSPARARNLSVSIGVSLYPEHGTDVDELLHKADAALYAAKHAGRNRVTVALSGDTIN